MWKIHLWGASGKEPIKKWLDSLSAEKLKAVAAELSLLELSGNKLRLPHSKSLGGGLFELRERSFGLRIYYCFNGKQIVVLLHSGDKGSQEKDIKLAKKRLKTLG